MIDLGLNTEKNKCMFMSHRLNAGKKSQKKNRDYQSFKNVAELKYFATTLQNKMVSSSSSSSLVFSPKAGFGRNQSPVRRPVWLWHTAF